MLDNIFRHHKHAPEKKAIPVKYCDKKTKHTHHNITIYSIKNSIFIQIGYKWRFVKD